MVSDYLKNVTCCWEGVKKVPVGDIHVTFGVRKVSDGVRKMSNSVNKVSKRYARNINKQKTI